jgi:hypothetical protein
MDQFEYLVSLRKELMGQIGVIENARHSLWWDNTASNYSTRRSLVNVLERYTTAAADHGILVVTRHCDCPNKQHPEYPTSNQYGFAIPYRSKKLVWEGDQLYQGNRLCKCPCSDRNAPSDHWVIDDLVFKRDADLILCRQLSSVLSDIHSAIESSATKKSRSGIREYLLRALLTLNDAILPQTVDEYINRRSRSYKPKQVQPRDSR